MDIVEFLTAQYDEEQRLAEAADAIDPAPWVAPVTEAGSNHLRDTGGYGLVIADDGVTLWFAPSGHMMTAASARHVAAHDPARVLADIAAKRERLRLYVIARNRYEDVTHDPSAARDKLEVGDAIGRWGMAQRAIATDLTLYADRPGYNPAWKVEEHHG